MRILVGLVAEKAFPNVDLSLVLSSCAGCCFGGLFSRSQRSHLHCSSQWIVFSSIHVVLSANAEWVQIGPQGSGSLLHPSCTEVSDCSGSGHWRVKSSVLAISVLHRADMAMTKFNERETKQDCRIDPECWSWVVAPFLPRLHWTCLSHVQEELHCSCKPLMLLVHYSWGLNNFLMANATSWTLYYFYHCQI